MVVGSKSASLAGILILKPFLRPWRTWMASSSPRLTRCKTVWAGDAEGAHGVDDRDVAGGGLVDEQRAELVVDADAPGSAGGVLLAGDEAVVEPTVQGGGGDAEDIGGLGDREQFAVGWLGGRLVGGDATVAAQTADDDRREPLAGRGPASLAVEDPGDRGVGVVDGEPLQQRDRVLVGADRRLVAGERDGELGDRAAAPANGQRRAALRARDVEDYLLDQAAQELLAVAVGGRRCGPHAAEVGSEPEQLLAFGRGERAGALALAHGELGLGGLKRCERLLPFALQAAGDEAVLGLDSAVAPLGALRLILGALDLQPPLLQRGVVILLERLGRGERGLDAGGGERGQQRVGDRLVDLGAADPETPLATALDEHAARAVVGRALVASPALVVHLQLAPAVPADRDSLQQRGALANGAARLVRARARVARDPRLVCLERLAIDEAGVVLPDQDLPVCLREATDALARLAVLVDVAFTTRLAE